MKLETVRNFINGKDFVGIRAHGVHRSHHISRDLLCTPDEWDESRQQMEIQITEIYQQAVNYIDEVEL